jgi:site-specific recombinase XerD
MNKTLSDYQAELILMRKQLKRNFPKVDRKGLDQILFDIAKENRNAKKKEKKKIPLWAKFFEWLVGEEHFQYI